MLSMEHAGRRLALVVGALVAAACNTPDLTASNAAPDAQQIAAQPSASMNFQGRVTAVNQAQQEFTLSTGAVIRVTSVTRIPPGSDALSLEQLQLLVSQQSGGSYISAHGTGTLVTSQPLVIEAARLTFKEKSAPGQQ
jgi:hypothetical protein